MLKQQDAFASQNGLKLMMRRRRRKGGGGGGRPANVCKNACVCVRWGWRNFWAAAPWFFCSAVGESFIL
jgi:hypothetical protein